MNVGVDFYSGGRGRRNLDMMSQIRLLKPEPIFNATDRLALARFFSTSDGGMEPEPDQALTSENRGDCFFSGNAQSGKDTMANFKKAALSRRKP